MNICIYGVCVCARGNLHGRSNYVFMYVCTYMHVYVNACMHEVFFMVERGMRMDARLHACMHVHTCIDWHIHVLVRLYMCIHMLTCCEYVYTHTHTHNTAELA